MFSIRHAAARVLTSRSVFIVTRPRTFTSIASVPFKSGQIAPSSHFQRRWASDEAVAKKEDGELPISELQATPQEEVENAIHADNAAADVDASASADSEAASANSTSEEPKSIAEEANRYLSMGREAVSSMLDGQDSGAAPSPGARPYREPAAPKQTVYVGNLFFDVTENDLTKEFSKYGTVETARIVRDARGLSKGFAYVKLGDIEQAQKVIDELNQQLFEGRRLTVSYANTDEGPHGHRREFKALNPPSKTLFIGNMSFEMTDRDLNALFRGIRNVIDVRVAIDRRTGQPRGFAHADFVDVKSAMDAMKVLSGKENYGRRLRIDYSYGPSTAPRNTPQ